MERDFVVNAGGDLKDPVHSQLPKLFSLLTPELFSTGVVQHTSIIPITNFKYKFIIDF